MYGYGLSFFTKPFYVLDFVIIGSTIVIEVLELIVVLNLSNFQIVVMSIVANNGSAALGEVAVLLLLLLRAWRLVRIIHGVFIGVHEQALKEKHRLVEEKEVLLEKQIELNNIILKKKRAARAYKFKVLLTVIRVSYLIVRSKILKLLVNNNA